MSPAAWQYRINSYQVGPYGSIYAYNRPVYNYYATPWTYGAAWTNPASYRYSYTPTSVAALYASQSMRGYSYNPWYGYMLNVSTPAYLGYTITPYAGYSPIAVPSVNYSVPLVPSGYYSGYVPAGYILP